ncbi:MAG: AAA family ATPase [Verrucomicrobia bacterium]|nr:MAG: AAA family ATPase [Verrucomicrobiota bacterium]
MLYYFFSLNHDLEENKNLFKGLEISKDGEFCKKHQHQYPVIFISFKDVRVSNFSGAYADIVKLIKRLYREHIYLLEGDFLLEHEKKLFKVLLNEEAKIADIKEAIRQLSEYLARKFNKAPIILIDEYDTPIQEGYLNGYYKEMIELMRSLLGQALKDNKYLGKAIITGITRISQESLFSGLNNISVFSLLQEKYGQYFGFSEEEVLKLLAVSQLSLSVESVKEWYNGYQIGKYVLYNPWSIICCLYDNGKLTSYWVNTASNELLHRLLLKSNVNVKQKLEALIQGQIIEQAIAENLVFLELDSQEEALWSLLLFTGYLKVLSSELHGRRLMAKIAIPNKEVSFVYDKIVEGWFSNKISMDSYDDFVKSLARGDVIEFKNYLSRYITQTASYFDFNKNTPEQVFHIFILGLVVGLRDDYTIYSNQESGFGRFDVVLFPKNTQEKGILLEFKKCENPADLLGKAQEALSQIKDKQYKEIFGKHDVKSILAIGLFFCGKQVEMAYEII